MSQFSKEFAKVQSRAHRINSRNGWWLERLHLQRVISIASPELSDSVRAIQIISLLGLAASELAEAMEAVRKHSPKTWGNHTEKDTLVRELAGTIVRCMDLAEHLQLPLGLAVEAELAENRTRGFKHGGKAA